MNLRVLNYFLVVAKEENISKAAHLMHVSQPSLSRQIMQLEDELGVKLFHRGNHKIVLTDEGILLKRRAQEMIELVEKTKQEINQKDQIVGEITIGSGEYQNTKILTDIICKFRKKYPLVKFNIFSGNSDSIKEQIEAGVIDLGLLNEPVDISKYNYIRLPMIEEWGVLVSKKSELSIKERVEPQDLVKYPLVFTHRKLIQEELLNWFGKYSENVSIAATGNLPYNLAMLARSEVGVCISLKLDCTYDDIKYIPLSPSLTSRTVLVWKKTQQYSRLTKEFIDYFQLCVNCIVDDTK